MPKIWIDTDGGIDDTLALILAFNAENLKILGITTVAGNVNVEKATKNVLNFLEIYELENIPVYKGSSKPLIKDLITAEYVHGSDGIGNLNLPQPIINAINEDYIEILKDIIDENPNELILITLGPLTNIAKLIKKHPNTVEKLKEIIIMGGAFFVPGNVTEHAEFNIFVDAEAANIVMKHSVQKFFFGLDVTTKHHFKDEFLSELQKKNTDNKRFLYIEHLLKFLLSLPGRNRYCFLHDPIALLYAIDKTIYKIKEFPIKVLTKDQYGKTLIDNTSNYKAKVCIDLNFEKVKACFLRFFI